MIEFKNGNLLTSDCDIICHQTNCFGVMGAGIAKQIRELYPYAYNSYKTFCDEYGAEYVFGHTLLCPITSGAHKYIANFFSQYEYGSRKNNHTNYKTFRSCCKKLKTMINLFYPNSRIKIGFPDHIGCGLAGGNWDIIKNIIEEEFADEKWLVEIWKL